MNIFKIFCKTVLAFFLIVGVILYFTSADLAVAIVGSFIATSVALGTIMTIGIPILFFLFLIKKVFVS